MSLVTYLRSDPATSGNPVTTDEVNQQARNHKAIMEGLKGFERLAFTRVRITDTGTQSNYNLDATVVAPVVGFGNIQWNGASAVTFTGFTNGADGHVRFIENITAAQALIFSHDVTSTAANRIFLPGSVSKQAIGPGGKVMLAYDSDSSRWRLTILDVGAPIDVAHAGGNFTASGSMTWTVASGDQTTFRYQQYGKHLRVQVLIITSTVGGTPAAELRITLPNGLACAGDTIVSNVWALDNTADARCYWRATAANTYIKILRHDGANWAASTDNTYVAFSADLLVS